MDECPTLPFDEPEPPEEWRPVVGWEGLYEVSSLGRVRSVRRTFQGRGNRGGNLLKTSPRDKYGHLGVCLCGEGGQLTRPVHLLVLEAFAEPRPEGQVARHGPGGKHDNRISNLQWGTQSENIRDKERDGTVGRGEANGHAVLTDRIVAEGRRRRAAGEGITALAREFGVKASALALAIAGSTWAHVLEPPVPPRRRSA